MEEKFSREAQRIMNERFNHDTLIALATIDDTTPSVRTVNSYYQNGSFYVITDASSNKMKQIKKNPNVSICGEWFTAHGIGKNLGHVLDKKNEVLIKQLRKAFKSWYNNGHIIEKNPNTCILCIQLTEGVLFSNGTRYDIDFTVDK